MGELDEGQHLFWGWEERVRTPSYKVTAFKWSGAVPLENGFRLAVNYMGNYKQFTFNFLNVHVSNNLREERQ